MLVFLSVHTPLQGGVTPIAAVLRSATAVKAGQDRFLTLTVDFRQKFVLTIGQIPFIFAIFSYTTTCKTLTVLRKQFDHCPPVLFFYLPL